MRPSLEPRQHALAGIGGSTTFVVGETNCESRGRVPAGGSFTHTSGELPGDVAHQISTIAERIFSPCLTIVTDLFRSLASHVRVTTSPRAASQKRRCAATRACSRTIFASGKGLFAHQKALFAHRRRHFAHRKGPFAPRSALFALRAWLFAHQKALFALRTHEFDKRKGLFDTRTRSCHHLTVPQ